MKVVDLNVVCFDCGSYTKNGKMKSTVSSWWMAECPICHRSVPVTQVRDFGYFSADEILRMEARARVLYGE